MSHLISIANLGPSSIQEATSSIRAVVSLIWPYSSTSRRYALLLAEEDFRLRQARGQVRVRFTGPAADAVAKNAIGIAEVVELKLEGAQWLERDQSVRTPGQSVDGELSFHRFLDLTVTRDGQPLRIFVDARTERGDSPPAAVVPLSLQTPAKRIVSTPQQYSSPWLSLSVTPPGVDPFVDDHINLHAIGRGNKRIRSSYGTFKDWRVVSDQTDSVQADDSTSFINAATAISAPAKSSKATGKLDSMKDNQVKNSIVSAAGDAEGKEPLTARNPHDAHRLAAKASSGVLTTTASSETQDKPSARVDPINRSSQDESQGSSASLELPLASTLAPALARRTASTPHAQPDAAMSRTMSSLFGFPSITPTPDAGLTSQSDQSVSARQTRAISDLELAFQAAPMPAEPEEDLYNVSDGAASPRAAATNEPTASKSSKSLADYLEPFQSLSSHPELHKHTTFDHWGQSEKSANAVDQTLIENGQAASSLHLPQHETIVISGNTTEADRMQSIEFSSLLPDARSKLTKAAGPNAARVPDHPPASTRDSVSNDVQQRDDVPISNESQPIASLSDLLPEISPIIETGASASRTSKDRQSIREFFKLDETTSRSKRSSLASKIASPASKHDASAQLFQARSKLQAADEVLAGNDKISNGAAKDQPGKSASKPTTQIQASNDRPAPGVRTNATYLSKLSSLARQVNVKSNMAHGQNVDVMAIVTQEPTEPVRSKTGPKDYHATLYITDESTAKHSQFSVDIFRPYKQHMPRTSPGDVILLRSFAVKSRERAPYLMSTDASAWCVWRFSEAPEVTQQNVLLPTGVTELANGPAIEYGDEERQQALVLHKWWKSSQSGALLHFQDHSAPERALLT